jgi:F-type H+-transporting ATPase subunit epsilon
VIKLTVGGSVTDQLYVSGGFAEVTPTRVTVLATEAVEVASLVRSEGASRLSAAEAEYAAADKMNTDALDTAMAKMQSAQALIDAAPAA